MEVNKLRIKCDTLEEDVNEKGNEILDLKIKVEVLEHVLNEVVSRVENITTPTKQGTKKRRRVKQMLTPSPAPKGDGDLEHPLEDDHGQGVHSQTDVDTDKSDNEITAEDILKMYDSGQE